MKKISVIVPTHNRCQLLKELLISLKNQTVPFHHFEVIVACDHCTDGTLEMLAKMKKELPNLTFLSLEKSGPAKARNAAAKLAKGKILAFTDDDCTAHMLWLETIWLAVLTNDESVVGWQGKTLTHRQAVTPLTHQIENLQGHAAVPTCNVAYHKEAFDQVGGFDERFPFAHNEDADLAWRIEQVGNISFLPEMIIVHPPRLTSFQKLASRMKMLQSEFLLFYKNPELYKAKRNASPWLTIYKEVFFVHQVRQWKSRFRFANRPQLMMQGLLLSLVWQLDLLWQLPNYWKANHRYKKLFRA